MSGIPMCASRAPSRRRTSEWTIEDGCTTTSIASYGSPNSQWASISSSPLFASVAESTVIFGPIRQVGWASACSAVTSASSSRVRPRNGPPDAVRTRPATLARSRPSRHWWSAECSLSTGRSSPPPRSCAATASSPAATRLSLLASASVTPCSRVHNVARTPANPTTAFRTRSGALRSSSRTASPPTWAFSTACSAASSASGVEPDWSAHSSSSGCAATISIACRPIDPVAPRIATRFTTQGCLSPREGAVQAQVRARSAMYAAGPAQSRESTRSRTPP